MKDINTDQIAANKTNRDRRIEDKLKSSLSLSYLQIINESQLHSDHYSGDGETHYKVIVVSSDFSNLTRIQRHQKINQALSEEFQLGLHALSLQVYSPEEWEQKKSQDQIQMS